MSSSSSDGASTPPVSETLYHAVVSFDDKEEMVLQLLLCELKCVTVWQGDEGVEERFIEGDDALDDDCGDRGQMEMHLIKVREEEREGDQEEEAANGSHRKKGGGKNKKKSAKKRGGRAATSVVHRSERMRQQVRARSSAFIRF